MKKTILIISLTAAVLIGLLWWGSQNTISRPSGNQLSSQSPLAISESLYDFGTISMAKGNVNHIFAITNLTNKDIVVSDITTSCMCTSAYIVDGNSKQGPFGMVGMGYVPKANLLIKAGETKNIDVVYDPNAHGPAGVGLIDRFVYLSGVEGATQLEIKAVVTP
ncbi:MAG: DUF1573 domain-containing protein [Patescibacteria group bacterium]